MKVCKDCRTKQEPDQFPHDKYGRPDTRCCLPCLDEQTPLLLTAQEAAARLNVTAETFRSLRLAEAGSFTPQKATPIPLYSRSAVDALVLA
jgi:hypothetical protein